MQAQFPNVRTHGHSHLFLEHVLKVTRAELDQPRQFLRIDVRLPLKHVDRVNDSPVANFCLRRNQSECELASRHVSGSVPPFFEEDVIRAPKHPRIVYRHSGVVNYHVAVSRLSDKVDEAPVPSVRAHVTLLPGEPLLASLRMGSWRMKILTVTQPLVLFLFKMRS